MIDQNYSRRNFLKTVSLGSSVALLPGLFPACERESRELPNILWITSEDNGRFLGCYGDEFARTPNLDRLAAEGILYENAFATAPVCAPARSTIISGLYPPTMGTQHMRSMNAIPEWIKFFPQYLRAAGYYCTNNSKEDYNMPKPDGTWDESSREATYQKRAPGQRFFAIFNITTSHESSIHTSLSDLQHDPAQVKLPPYHPDTPEMRHDWAQYYDKVTEMDRRVGEILTELDAAGLAEETIVFYYSDHAGVLARSKRFCYDSGLHVPFMVRFPKKFQHLAPGKPGTRTDRLISFVDLAPTVLSLVNIPIPEYMQGQAFLGGQASRERKYAYSFRGRMDERYDMMRTVRDKKFRYIRNYLPHRIYGQHVEYLWKAPSMQSWERAYRAGQCNAVQSIFWQPKPPEELYDLENDPYEVNNLADNPRYKNDLFRLRKACRDWSMEIRDSGFMPEGEMLEQAQAGEIYEVVRSTEYQLGRIIETAEKATSGDIDFYETMVDRLTEANPVTRYWAATGCLILGKEASGAAGELKRRLKDPVGDIQVTAAEALCVMGETEAGLSGLIAALKHENSKVVLHAVNSLECLGELARAALPALKSLTEHEDNYVRRAAHYTIEKLTG